MVLPRALGHAIPSWLSSLGSSAPGQGAGPLKVAHFLGGVLIIAHGVPKFPALQVGVRKWRGLDANLGSRFSSQMLRTEVPAGPWGF